MRATNTSEVTVYPSRPGGFPPASFWRSSDAYSYMRAMQDAGCRCGLNECPANSFAMHWKEVSRRTPSNH